MQKAFKLWTIIEEQDKKHEYEKEHEIGPGTSGGCLARRFLDPPGPIGLPGGQGPGCRADCDHFHLQERTLRERGHGPEIGPLFQDESRSLDWPSGPVRSGGRVA